MVWPRDYKTFFVLNPSEHEICPTNKYLITNNWKVLLKIPEHEKFFPNVYENANYCWHCHIY